MRILGIETSCDETAVCLIDAEGAIPDAMHFRILGNSLHSQATTHSLYGGVFPNLAKREHARNLTLLLTNTLEQAGMSRPRLDIARHSSKAASEKIECILEREPGLFEQLSELLERTAVPDIDAIAVTVGPGLEPALWVGINFARALSAAWNIPVVGVNHMEGHFLISLLRSERDEEFSICNVKFPILGLLISGGHTELILSRELRKYERLGETRDDAAGEAFDKVARLLGLSYPGGPEISRLAEAARAGDEATPHHMQLPRPMISDASYDFSFSGLKTAVRRFVNGRVLNEYEKSAIALEFETAVADVLVEKTRRAADEYGAKTLVVGGGVSANVHIRRRLTETFSEMDCPVFFPAPEYATDNALMIAIAGYFQAKKMDFVNPDMLKASGNLRLG